jgi:hypothetical protein
MAKAPKTRASKQPYVSPSQVVLSGFESPFSQSLNPNNRWVVLSHKIPWDTLVGVYQNRLNNEQTGASGINPRVAIGAIIIKHICDLSDRETVLQIQENMYMQYFIGYSSFSNEEPFDPSLFVDFRKRLGKEELDRINEKLLGLGESERLPDNSLVEENKEAKEISITPIANQGSCIVDATACPQDISYPTDLNLLNDAREKSEQIIDLLYPLTELSIKPRTYRKEARKMYLKTAQKKSKTKKEIRRALKKQLGYLRRNIGTIHNLLDILPNIPLNKHEYKYLLVIQTLYEQQKYLFNNNIHSVEHRIVSIHQPHVRPIVRGKANAKVEFGAKINLSIMNGYSFLEDLSWDAFNEGTRLMSTIEKYKQRFGYYPQKVMVDKIYCNRENRKKLKELNIELRAKPLGRPKAVAENHVSPGERNPIEGKFGQAKTAYGLNRIKARLSQTSESWIASIILVLNLVKLTGEVLYSLFRNVFIYSYRILKRYYQTKAEILCRMALT